MFFSKKCVFSFFFSLFFFSGASISVLLVVSLLLDEAVVEHIPSDGDTYVYVAGLGAIVAQIGADDEGRYAAYDGELFQMGEGRELSAIVCLARFVGEDRLYRYECVGFESCL